MEIKWLEIRWLAHFKRREMRYKNKNEPESVKVVLMIGMGVYAR
jgi:hypothetical protein